MCRGAAILPPFRARMITAQPLRGNRATHEMRADNVFVTNAHILYHFIAKMSIVFPFCSSGTAPARLRKAVLLPSVMPRFAPFYHRRRARFPCRPGKRSFFPAPDAFVFLSSQNRRCGAAPPATHILIEKAVACRALRHRPAETTLPLPCPHRISPPPARPTAFRSGPTRSPRSCSPAVAPMSCSPPSLPDGPAAARPAFSACRHPIVTITHPLLIRKPVRRFWRQTKKRG